MNKAALTLWSFLLLGVCFALNTRHNTFPFHYHPDEPGKVEQIMDGEWNFHHPMLLLAATDALVDLRRVPKTEQAIVEVGRGVSAAFTAIAVVALSLLAYLWRGWPAALAAGGALALHHQLFELSHYMKEDSALLMGLALTFLAAKLYSQRPGTGTTAALGIAVGIAISGKYLGAAGLLIALPLLWQAPGEQRWPRIALFAAMLAVTFALVNLPLFTHLATFQSSFDREVQLVVRGQAGMTRSVPHTQYWNVFIDNTTPVIWLLIPIFLARCWHDRRSIPLAKWLLIAFPFAYALALSFSPKSNDRYFLPATAMFTLLAALGVEDAVRLIAGHFPPVRAVAAAGLLLLAGQIPSWWRYETAFQRDDNAELIEWLRAGKDVPPTATLAKDNRIRLPDPEKKKHAARIGEVPQKIIAGKFVADLGPLAALPARGITHVAVSESDYGKFFLDSQRPQESQVADYLRRQAFYQELLRGDPPLKLLFNRDRGTVIYLHPGIRVYRLAPQG